MAAGSRMELYLSLALMGAAPHFPCATATTCRSAYVEEQTTL